MNEKRAAELKQIIEAKEAAGGFTLIEVETNKHGILTVNEALTILSSGQSLNDGFSQIVMGVYADGGKVSLKGQNDGLYFMSGNLAATL